MVSVPATNVFGPMLFGYEVEDAVLNHLKTWMTTYIHEAERRTGRSPVALVRTWTTMNQFEKSQGDPTPAVIVVSPGISSFEMSGAGVYSGWFEIIAGAIVNARDKAANRELVAIYAACVRNIFMNKPSLGGFAKGFRPETEEYDRDPNDYLPVGASALVTCSFLITSIAASGVGPKEPDDNPDPLGQVEEVDIDGRVAWDGREYGEETIPLVRRSAP